MNAPFRKTCTQQEFFAWAEAQQTRYEFDGIGPVAMTGDTIRHNLIMINILVALRARLAGSRHTPLGPDAGVVTVGSAVRYPDALITGSPIDDEARVVADVAVVFEIISPSSNRMDRIIKVREYAAVSTILRYVIVETVTHGLTVLSRADGNAPWTNTPLTEEDTLDLPEAATSLPVADIYAGLAIPPGQED